MNTRTRKLLIISLLVAFVLANFSLALTIKTKSSPPRSPIEEKSNQSSTGRFYNQCVNQKMKQLTREMQNRKKQALNEYKMALKELRTGTTATSTSTTSTSTIKEMKKQVRLNYVTELKNINKWFRNAVKEAKRECLRTSTTTPTSTTSTSTSAQ